MELAVKRCPADPDSIQIGIDGGETPEGIFKNKMKLVVY